MSFVLLELCREPDWVLTGTARILPEAGSSSGRQSASMPHTSGGAPPPPLSAGHCPPAE